VGFLFMLVSLLGLVALVVIIVNVILSLGLVHIPSIPDQWTIPLGFILFVFFILLFGPGGHILRHYTGTLDDLLNAADRVGKGDYSARVQEEGPRQVRTMARAFNDMASRLHVLDEQRRSLLADVTHELRSPLTVMQGNLEGMLDGIYPASEVNLRMLLEETSIISRLIEDLRTLALAESGALQLNKEPTDLALLVRETTDSFQMQAKTAGVTLRVQAAANLPWLDLDPGRIRQVLNNLLANALRYTPSGGEVSILYRQKEGQAMIEVRDTGAGIPPEELPHVFERFYKSTDSGGMGLGLAIAKKLVESHGGTITAESTPEAGTTMRVTLLAKKIL